MKVIIIEDNKLDQQILEKMVGNTPGLEHKGTFGNAIEAIELLSTLSPDLILLDVEMPGMTGLEFIEAIKDVPQIIMVTGNSQYAIDAFENDVTDFLVKPPEKSRFEKAIQKAQKIHDWLILDAEDDEHIFIRVDREDVKVLLKDILYVEAQADYVRVITAEKKYMVLSTMKSISTKLPEDSFARVHRSFIVNVSNVDSFNGQDIKIGDTSIPVSRSGKKELKEKASFK